MRAASNPGKGNKRREERVSAALPVILGDLAAVTEDISASGMSFVTDGSFELGAPIAFVVDFDGPAGKMLLRCTGHVVRTESQQTRLKVAVKITESMMEMA